MDQITTRPTPFGRNIAGQNLFIVQNGIPLQDALEQAAVLLSTATVLCAETADSDVHTARALNRAIQQLVETSKGLIDASLDGVLEHAHG